MRTEEVVVYQVKDLSPEQKRAAEVLLGHAVSEDEALSIRSLGAESLIPCGLSVAESVAALDELASRWARVDSFPLDPEEEEAAVLEAMRSSRPNFRSVR